MRGHEVRLQPHHTVLDPPFHLPLILGHRLEALSVRRCHIGESSLDMTTFSTVMLQAGAKLGRVVVHTPQPTSLNGTLLTPILFGRLIFKSFGVYPPVIPSRAPLPTERPYGQPIIRALYPSRSPSLGCPRCTGPNRQSIRVCARRDRDVMSGMRSYAASHHSREREMISNFTSHKARYGQKSPAEVPVLPDQCKPRLIGSYCHILVNFWSLR